MYVCHCDMCDTVIKLGDYKFAVVSQQCIHEESKEYKDASEYIRDANKTYSNLKVNEICENCKKVYDSLFKLRKESIAKILKEIENIYKMKPKTKRKKRGRNEKI